MFRTFAFSALLPLFVLSAAIAQDYKVEKLDQTAPEDVSPEIAALLQPTGLKFVKGESRTVCEFWFCKEWPISKEAKVSAEVNYPLTQGQVIGVARYPRKGNDFRDQDILAVGRHHQRES